jgi:hypothetical protein
MKGKYFKIELAKKTYTLISETDFYKETPYKKSDLINLSKSVYPNQANDYLLLKHKGLSFPVDYKLAPFVKYCWNHKLLTEGWNQPDKVNLGFVSFEHYMENGEGTLCFLERMLEGLDYKIINNIQTINERPVEKKIQEEKTLHKKGFYVISIESNMIALSFSEHLMEKLYKKLHLAQNEKRLPGGAILSEYDLQGLRKGK